MVEKLYELWNKISESLNRHYKLSVLMVLIAYYVLNVTAGFIKGGRWDLYQNIAIADRFLNGQGFYYSAIEASSPYFPGVAFLAAFIGWGGVIYPWRDYILLAIASLIGTAFFYALIKLGEFFSGNKWISLIVTSGLLFTGFDRYKFYMNEFKADSCVLLIGIVLAYFIEKFEKDKKRINAKYLLLISVFAFVMDITKQQALYIDVALGLYLLFTKKFLLVEKIKILGSLILAGIVDLLVIFSIPNIQIQVIQNLKDMPYWDIKDIIKQMENDFLCHKLFFILLIVFALFWIIKKIEISSLATKWLIISMFFGCAQIAGGWKIGGNAGNYEVGMVTFLPFVVMVTDYFFSNYIVELKKQNVIAVCDIVLICCSVMVYLYVGYSQIPTVFEKIQTDKEASEYLSNKFGGETIMYYSDEYMRVARSTVVPGMDVFSVPYFIEEYRDVRAEYIKNQTYKYLYVNKNNFVKWDTNSMTYFDHESNAAELLDEYYVVIEDANMPESLQGQLYVAKESD